MTTATTPRKRYEPPSVGIRILRTAHGLTIAALKERIEEQGVEVTADHLSNCELGHKQPSDALVHAWAKALGIHPLDVKRGTPISEQVPA